MLAVRITDECLQVVWLCNTFSVCMVEMYSENGCGMYVAWVGLKRNQCE